MDTFANGAANTVSLVLATLLLGAVFQLIRTLTHDRRDCSHELSESRADCQWEKQINDELITACQRAQVPLPAITFQQRPPTPSRRARKRGVDERDRAT